MGLEDLLDRYVAKDDEQAMAELVRQTRPKLIAVARRICGADAEDAVQTAYLSLAKRGGLGGSPVLPWLLTAVARIAYRSKATRAREHAIAERLAPSAAPPEPPEIAVGREEALLLRREVWKLPPDYRDALQLRYLHGLSGAETARLLGVNESTLRTRLQRGRLLLRSRLARVLSPFLVLPWLLLDKKAAGALVLGGSMKLKLAIAALLLAALAASYVAARGRSATPRAAPAEARVRAAPDAPQPVVSEGASAFGAVGRDDVQPVRVSEEDRRRYLEWRRVRSALADVRRISRETEALVREIKGEQEEPAAVADPSTAAYLRDMIREYRTMAAGAARLELLQRIAGTHRKYAAATRDPAFLPFFEDVIRSSDVEDERELAVPECDDRSLDLLLRLLGHEDPSVRAAAIRSLSWSEDPRAVAAVVEGLGDDAPAVRWTAAVELEFAVADRAPAASLLERLPRETHPLAADAMVRAVLALDPEGGVRRVKAAVATAPASVREVVLGALAAPEHDASPVAVEPAPADPGEGAAPRSDPETHAYLDRLVRAYRSLPQGPERSATVERLATAHASYLAKTGDASFLPVVAGIARESPDVDERTRILGSFHGTSDRRVVDLIVELKGSAEPRVRSSVAAALAWVRGAEAPRARTELVGLLSDRNPAVRAAVALLLGVPVADPNNSPALLASLKEETEVVAAYAMIDALLRLDPAQGRARIDDAASAAPAAKPVIDAALRLHDERGK